MPAQNPFPKFEEILSAARFATYLLWAENDRDRALRLYSLNAQLCECLHIPLHMLEVSLRNRIHTLLQASHGDLWFDLPEFQNNPYQAEMLESARENLTGEKKIETPDRIVAALTFGYWTSFLGKEYEDLWQTKLHQIAKREDGKGLRRKDFSKPLGPIRMLRNRIAHHEPVLYWDLQKHYRNIVQITRWLSPVAADWTDSHSRFHEVYPREGVDLKRDAL